MAPAPDYLRAMRHLLALLIVFPVAAFAADPIEGTWRTPADADGRAGLVRIVPCEGGFCGTVVADMTAGGDRVPSDLQGMTILQGVSRQDGIYGGGRVSNPATGRSYVARLILQGDRLDVGGCVMAICRSGGVWSRVD
ncbi:DUF2147 domain-containing protein [Falsirhodobacter algicola]|uniref:DUF2147 domain-containing protein n=1 Tax=Falsirhodobacter algicola TaxID=2692330 RepID=A0A8J8MRR3_9RHOB|nr:DUF2147 domain-containing protein [Falsirhodobacter algicola]QUS34998.1 DUF2147 domain-containing protein [Falsirhodobacter algicola]